MMGTDPLLPALMRTPWKRHQNHSGLTIPKFAVMRNTGTTRLDGEIVHKSAQPNTTTGQLYLVNGEFEVPNSTTKEGICWPGLHHSVYAQYDSGDGTPAVGETWGPESGSWLLHKNQAGFQITGTPVTSGGLNIVPVMQVLGSSNHHAIAVLTGGTLDANDLSTPATTILNSTMPSQVGDVYLPAAGGTWSLAEGGATIYNAKPFRYGDDSSPLLLEKYNGLWVVDRADRWTPIYRTSFDGSHTSGNDVTFDGSPVTKGNIASEAGSTITIEAPVLTNTYYWEVECGGSASIGSATAGDHTLNVALLKNGAASPPSTTGSTSTGIGSVASLGVYGSTIPFHFRSVVELEQGDTLKVNVIGTAGGAISAFSIANSVLSIKPLFGY